MNEIQKPIHRSSIRQVLGREFYILKRKVDWLRKDVKWSTSKAEKFNQNIIFSHKSIILRPLKDVDMYLQVNKKTNLEKATRHLNRVVIKPGETFSFWRLVGRPSKRKGYLEGLVLKQGKISKNIGGGLCQLGNLLFWIFAHSPLTITERYRHSYDVFPDINRSIPFGAGATLSYNHIDLQIKNNTENTFQINLWLDDEYLNGELLSEKPIEKKYEVVEQNHIIKQQMWGGYSRHNQIVQIESKSDGTKQERLLVENHAIMMYNPFLTETTKEKK